MISIDHLLQEIDGLLQEIAKAKHSNDPDRMRAALDKAEQPLAEMRGHLNMYTLSMNVMPPNGRGG